MSHPLVVHCKRAAHDVYIGRPSKWGNPFVIGANGSRDDVVRQYREWVLQQPELMAALGELKGKVLGCWCSPQSCHGDVLAELANGSIIDDFRGPYRWLSNFHLCEIHFEGLVFPSTEHAYQAAKTLDLDARKQFTDAAMTCGQAKRGGRRLLLREDWEAAKDAVMGLVLFDKFTRHADLRSKLLATAPAFLMEMNTWNDIYWGVCNGVGKNRLGQLLMEIRGSIK